MATRRGGHPNSHIKHTHAMMKHMEKSAWKSKKFMFGALVEAALIVFIVIAFLRFDEIDWPLATVLMLIIFTMGSVALVFNGYQAALDKYVRGAALGKVVESQPGLMASLFGRSGRSDPEEIEAEEPVDPDDEGDGI